MNCATTLTLYLVPAADWGEKPVPDEDFSLFVEDALVIERCIGKGVNLANERKRYQLCCRRIQEAVCRMVKTFDQEILSEEYFYILNRMLEQHPLETTRYRLTTCFFPPDLVPVQIARLKALAEKAGFANSESINKRLAFLNKALTAHAGVVEIPRYFSAGQSYVLPERALSEYASPSLPLDDDEDELSDDQIADMTDILRARIEKALATGCDVNFSNQPHFIIADLLNEFVYTNQPGIKEQTIRVVYLDGSEAEPFPLRCLTRRQEAENTAAIHPPVKAALVSMRHLEMDEAVDFAWFRNRKVSASLSYAETDAYCTAETVDILGSHAQHLNLELYQTGLETAVVGFYRGLVKELRRRKACGQTAFLRVVPMYFDRKSGNYKPGKLWA